MSVLITSEFLGLLEASVASAVMGRQSIAQPVKSLREGH